MRTPLGSPVAAATPLAIAVAALLAASALECGQGAGSQPTAGSGREVEETESSQADLSSLPKLPGIGPGSHHPFHLLEASIADIHRAIQERVVTCHDIVKAYVARAVAYDGPCTRLVTADGQPVPETTGYVRAGAPIAYPTSTLPASDMLPDLGQYAGAPIEFRVPPLPREPSL